MPILDAYFSILVQNHQHAKMCEVSKVHVVPMSPFVGGEIVSQLSSF